MGVLEGVEKYRLALAQAEVRRMVLRDNYQSLPWQEEVSGYFIGTL